jgi:hypothetical protein
MTGIDYARIIVRGCLQRDYCDARVADTDVHNRITPRFGQYLPIAVGMTKEGASNRA